MAYDQLEGAQSQLEDRINHLERMISYLECAGAFFLGSGIVIFVYPFFKAPTLEVLVQWINSTAGPFGLAAFMFVAASVYQQQMQIAMTRAQDKRQERERRLADAERECQVWVGEYLRLLETIELFTCGRDVGDSGVTRGRYAYRLLLGRVEQWGDPSQTRLSDERRRVAPFLVAISTLMRAVDNLVDPDTRKRWKSKLHVILSDEETEVLSYFQRLEGRGEKTVKDWLNE